MKKKLFHVIHRAGIVVSTDLPEPPAVTLLRAIPFSLAVLWRMVLVFPFMIIALIMFGIIAAFFMFIIAFVSPFLTIIAGTAFGVASSVLPVIVGARLGLQAKQSSMRNSYLGLLLPAIGYGLFEVFCVLLIVAGAATVYFLATPLTLDDLGRFAAMDNSMVLEQLIALDPAVTLSVLWVAGVLIIGLRAALLMPFAGASVGADPGGRPHTPFYGFGRDFLSMLFVVVIAYILSAFAVPLSIAICYLLGYGESLTAAMAQLETTQGLDALDLLGLETGIFIGLALIFYIWAISLQSAAGVVSYMDEARAVADQQNAFDMSMDDHLQKISSGATPPDRPMQSEDVMELIRSRMQQNKR